MALGPVEYIIVGFPENNFQGKIAPELANLIEVEQFASWTWSFWPRMSTAQS